MIQITPYLYQTGLAVESDPEDWPDECLVLDMTFIDDADYKPMDEDLWDIVRARVMEAIRKAAGKPIVTMCMAGENRSGLASAIILVERDGMPVGEAIRLIHSKAQKGAEYRGLLWNKAFVAALIKHYT